MPKKLNKQVAHFAMNESTIKLKKTAGLTTQPTTTSTLKKTDGLTIQPTTTSKLKKADGLTTEQTTKSTPKTTDDFTAQQTRTFKPKKTESLTVEPITTSIPKTTDSSTSTTQPKDCKKALRLGMETGEILNAQITASSEKNSYHGADNARLNQQGPGHSYAWLPATASGSWLQVDFELQATISQVLTQGGGYRDYQWVKTYTLSYSSNGVNFNPYRQNGVAKEFPGNRDRDTIVRQDISPVIVARYIRILPQTWHKNVALRVDFSGCLKGIKSKPCGLLKMGVEAW
ncbi:Hypothetical predicted protein [Paramuricea clavata]|uniref:Uncharacterized protein n=1 Tax=Paramuricea clavata TaxID=317549 RepID=A0A6S7H7L7_PARCT|nr:Hypothetical predicted protein [Paramuricea clavata]